MWGNWTGAQTEKGLEITLPQQHVSEIAIVFEIIGGNLLPTRISFDAPPARSDTSPRTRTPIMGWSSWNHFPININEGVIRARPMPHISGVRPQESRPPFYPGTT